MSTYLELCNLLHTETGESGGDLTAVADLSGYERRIAKYVADAWEDIQLLHTEWRFLRMSALPTVTVGATSLDADAWVYANLSTYIDIIHTETFSIYLTATGITDESKLIYVPWEQWKERFGITYADGETGRPKYVTIDPDTDVLILGPIPDSSYTVSFEFKKTPQRFSSNSDTPNILDALHPVIYWRALEAYGLAEESDAARYRGRRQYKHFLRLLKNRELPPITIGGPLA